LTKYREFFERYRELIPCAYASLRGINSLKSAALEPVHQCGINKLTREDPALLQSYVRQLCVVLDSSLLLDRPKDFRFFSHAYQSFILSKIQGLNEAGVSLEACGRWSAVFLILRKFIADAYTVFRGFLPKTQLTNRTMLNGGNLNEMESYVSAFTGFYSSNIVLDSLMMKTIRDWDKAHLAALEDRDLEDFEPEIQYVDLYDVTRHLKSVGLFESKGYKYYEEVFGKEIVELAKEFVPTM